MLVISGTLTLRALSEGRRNLYHRGRSTTLNVESHNRRTVEQYKPIATTEECFREGKMDTTCGVDVDVVGYDYFRVLPAVQICRVINLLQINK